MWEGGPVVLDVVEHTIRDLEHGLVDDVLVGLDAELEAPESLRQPVDELQFLAAARRRNGHCARLPGRPFTGQGALENPLGR